MAILLSGIAEPRAAADRQRAEPVVVSSVAIRVAALDRAFDGLLLAPPAKMALRVANEHAPQSQTTSSSVGAARPRRLAFRYDATAPPRAL
jgi:hypothetical protein